MTEKILHFLWQNRIFPEVLSTVDNQIVQVVHPGFPSVDAGADFFQAKIKIKDKIWVGSVEIHVKSSDWYRHNHHKDKSYNNVILHVVHRFDKPVYRTNGEPVPTLELPIPEHIYRRFYQLYSRQTVVKCKNSANNLPYVLKQNWLENLLIERLEQRYAEISALLQVLQNDWEQAFYIKLARSFGQKVNGEAFEQLAKSLDLKIIQRNADNRLIVEALLYGQAGMLSQQVDDEYFTRLKQEYAYQRAKYKLEPLSLEIWRFMRIRPHNFPTIRLSQLAGLLTQKQRLFTFIRETGDIDEIKRLFTAQASPYWDNHYRFGTKTKRSYHKTLGNSSVQNILINSVAPFLYAYGRYMQEQKYIDKAMDLLSALDFERNYISRLFVQSNFPGENAAHSQALLQLYKDYCVKERCFVCRIGSSILTDKYS